MRTSASNEASDTFWVDTIDSPLFLELLGKVGIASPPVKGDHVHVMAAMLFRSVSSAIQSKRGRLVQRMAARVTGHEPM